MSATIYNQTRTIQAGPNFITNGDGAQGTTNWTEGYYTAAVKPSGTFTAAAGTGNFVISSTTTTPLGNGTTSLLFTKSAVNAQGKCAQYECDLSVGYRTKVLYINIDYIVNSGTFTAGSSSTSSSLIWYTSFYDGSTWTVAEPTTFKLFSNSTTVSDVFRANIQSPNNATKMRLIAYVAESTTSAWALKAVCTVGTSPYVYGTPITDWASYTPNAAVNQGFGTLASSDLYWRRVGSNLEVRGSFVCGTVAASEARLALPNAFVTTTDVVTNTNIGIFVPGNSTVSKGGVIIKQNAVSYVCFSTANVFYSSAENPLSPSVGTNLGGNGYKFGVQFSTPILGWSSSVQMSDNAAQNIVCCSYNKSATQAVTASVTNITFPNKTFDSTGSFDGTTFTAPVAGYYSITGAYIYATTAAGFTIFAYVNGIVNIGLGSNNSNGGDTATISGVLYLNAGDALTIRSNITVTLGAGGYLQIHRLAGPNSIGATETVSCRYTTAAGQSIPNTGAVVDFGTKVWDNTGSVSGTGTSWKFTAPIAGEYQVNAAVLYTTATFSVNTGVSLQIMKNGSATEYSYLAIVYPQVTASILIAINGASTIKLLAGDYIQVLTDHGEATNRALFAGATANWVEIKKIGNY